MRPSLTQNTYYSPMKSRHLSCCSISSESTARKQLRLGFDRLQSPQNLSLLTQCALVSKTCTGVFARIGVTHIGAEELKSGALPHIALKCSSIMHQIIVLHSFLLDTVGDGCWTFLRHLLSDVSFAKARWLVRPRHIVPEPNNRFLEKH